jgi:hypothetical protein
MVTFASIPWLVLGAAVMSGEIRHVLDILDFSDLGPLTLSFFLSVVGLGLAVNYYIFFRNGAEELVKYPGLLRMKPNSSVWKLYAVSIPLSHIGFFVMIYLMGDLFAPVNF